MIFLVFATLFVVSYGQLNPNGCGKRPLVASSSRLYGDDNDERIVGGTTAVAGDWGWQVSLTSNLNHICGGTLINSNWIVTAAHCVYPNQALSTYGVDIGLHDRINKESWAYSRKISKIIIHSSYNSQTFANDIALLKLATPAAIDNRYIIPACVLKANESLAGLTGWATGWGSLTANGAASRYNLQVSLPILTDSRCVSKYSAYTSIQTKSQICAGETSQNKDTCQGDSGGPLVIKHSTTGLWTLVGITSFGIKCGDGGVYTRLSNFASWIEQQMSSNP